MTTPGLPPDSELAAGQPVKASHLRTLRDYIANAAAQALAPSDAAADAAVDRAVAAGEVLSPALASGTYVAKTELGAPVSVPTSPLAPSADQSFAAASATGWLTTVTKAFKARRARIRVTTGGGTIDAGLYAANGTRLVSAGTTGNGPNGFAKEIALKPTTIPAGPVKMELSQSVGTAVFAGHATYGDLVGAETIPAAHPLPATLPTGAIPISKVPCIEFLPDDPTPLSTATPYTRTDMGVYVVGQKASGTLYGMKAATFAGGGTFAHSTDGGATWIDSGVTVASQFGTGRKVLDIIITPDDTSFMFAVADDGKVWRGSPGVWNAWTDVTPAGLVAGTTGRYRLLAHNGTYLFYGVYGQVNDQANVYRSADNGTAWTTSLSISNARHIHAVRVDPAIAHAGGGYAAAAKVAGTWGSGSPWIHVSVGDDGYGGRGYYFSQDSGATWKWLSQLNRYGIDFAFPYAPVGVPIRVLMEGDGTNQAHVFHYDMANRAAGSVPPATGNSVLTDATVWPDFDPDDDGAAWTGSGRGIHITAENNLFFISDGENGQIGTRHGIWMAKGPHFTTPVLVEELSSRWDIVPGGFGHTFESGAFLLNGRYRMTKPKFVGQ